MLRIIPAILTSSVRELRKRVELVAPFVDLVQIDVMDGAFVPEVSFSKPEEIAARHLPVAFEAHLMINEPQKHVRDWLKAGAARLIVHAESRGNIGLAIKKVKKYNRKIGLAFNPETVIADYEDLLEVVDFVQFMGVNPGAMGREFHANVFDKIKYIKNKKSKTPIAVDGGVSEENIVRLARAGAEDLVVGSAIFLQEDPVEALKQLQDKLRTI